MCVFVTGSSGRADQAMIRSFPTSRATLPTSMRYPCPRASRMRPRSRSRRFPLAALRGLTAAALHAEVVHSNLRMLATRAHSWQPQCGGLVCPPTPARTVRHEATSNREMFTR